MTEETDIIEKQKVVTSAAIATIKEEIATLEVAISQKKAELKKLEKALKALE